MLRKVIIILLAAIGILFAAASVGRILTVYSISSDVKKLFASSGDIKKTFSYEQLKGLPEPVQRYFKYSLKEGQPYISTVRLTHGGTFKTGLDKDWITIKGEQFYTVQEPGFLWKGTTSMFIARDRYISGKGGLTIYLLGIIKIIHGEGPEYNQGELLRWLGECIWFPTAFLPSENLSWSPIDTNRARVSFKYNGLDIFYIVTFNKIGQITRLETKRYMNSEKLETWAGVCGEYKEFNSVNIPSYIEGMWILSGKEFSYARFTIKNIEYNKKSQN